jgi:uncharacterized BrkB/YihY/UPF0761 family membrane protein
MPYSFYKARGLYYKIIKHSSYYFKYTRQGRSYNASGIAIAYYALFSLLPILTFANRFLIPYLNYKSNYLE